MNEKNTSKKKSKPLVLVNADGNPEVMVSEVQALNAWLTMDLKELRQQGDTTVPTQAVAKFQDLAGQIEKQVTEATTTKEVALRKPSKLEAFLPKGLVKKGLEIVDLAKSRRFSAEQVVGQLENELGEVKSSVTKTLRIVRRSRNFQNQFITTSQSIKKDIEEALKVLDGASPEWKQNTVYLDGRKSLERLFNRLVGSRSVLTVVSHSLSLAETTSEQILETIETQMTTVTPMIYNIYMQIEQTLTNKAAMQLGISANNLITKMLAGAQEVSRSSHETLQELINLKMVDHAEIENLLESLKEMKEDMTLALEEAHAQNYEASKQLDEVTDRVLRGGFGEVIDGEFKVVEGE